MVGGGAHQETDKDIILMADHHYKSVSAQTGVFFRLISQINQQVKLNSFLLWKSRHRHY